MAILFFVTRSSQKNPSQGACPHKGCSWPDWAIMTPMSPPAPAPPPAPINGTGLSGLTRAKDGGGKGARASWIGDVISLPPPFPTEFFRGGAGERGFSGGSPGDLKTLDPPRPLPHLSTPGSGPRLARLGLPGVKRRGGEAGTRDQRPPDHPQSYLSNSQ